MRRIYRLSLVVILFTVLVLVVLTIRGFFSSLHEEEVSVRTGSVDLHLRDVMVNNQKYSRNARQRGVNGGTVRPSDFIPLQFSLSNQGLNSVDFEIEFCIAWETEESEKGKFYIYPQTIEDRAIKEDIRYNYGKNALINPSDDQNDISFSEDKRLGVKGVVDDGLIGGNETLQFQYKLVLWEDEEIKAFPEAFNSKYFDVMIVVTGELVIHRLWDKQIDENIRFLCLTDLNKPSLEETGLAKNYYYTKAGDIDLRGFAKAFDVSEGDISANITYTSYPSFDPYKVGDYEITYDVKNTLGISAHPLVITISIWNFKQIVSGYYHSLVLTTHGLVYGWGYNIDGQVGVGSSTQYDTPVKIDGLFDIVDIKAGMGSSYALNSKGEIYSWGRNEYGKLGDGTTIRKTTPNKINNPPGVRFVSLHAGYNTAGAISDNGDVYTWGYANYGAAGHNNTTEYRVPTKTDITDAISLDLGYYNGAAVSKDGRLYTWGDNIYGQLGWGNGFGAGTNFPKIVTFFEQNNIKIKQVSVGWYHMAAVSEQGLLYTWGYGAAGRLGNNQTVNMNSPVLINISGKVTKAVAAYYHTGALLETNSVLLWGNNEYGKLGINSLTAKHVPTSPLITLNAIDFSLAFQSSFILTNEGAYGSGYGGTGVLGTGNNSSSDVFLKWSFTPPTPD